MLRYSLTTLLLIFTMAVFAKDYTFHEGENTMESFAPVNATFTATVNGKVLVEAQEVFEVSYNGKVIEHKYVPGSGYAYVYEVNDVKIGSTINITSSFVWNSLGAKLCITQFGEGQAIPVEVKNVTPALNKTFPWLTTGMISINFNKMVTVSKIKFVVGDNYTTDVDDVHLGSSIGFNITNALNTALNDGVLQAGDDFCVRIEGLRDADDKDNLYNGDGILELSYKAPYPQHNFVGATVGEAQLSYMQVNTYEFLSYYSPEQEDGLFVFEFDAEVGKVGSVTMSMGNIDLDASGKYHRSGLPYTIQGNKVLVDARGTLRTLAILFPAIVDETPEEGTEVNEALGTFDIEHMTITLSNVMDKNGNAFRCDAQGSVGSYSFVMGYKEIIDEAYMDGDNVFEGDEVKAADEISLWISNSDMKFDGIEITYFVKVDNPNDEAEGVIEQRRAVVTEYTVEQDPVEGAIVDFYMPQMPGAVVGSTIRVTLLNARTSDGMPHHLYIEFKAKEDLADCIQHLMVRTDRIGNTYRLDGVKTTDSRRGIYIQNGKKIIKF